LDYVDEINESDIEIIVSRLKGEIVGFTVLKKLSDESCEIQLGAVSPQFQSLGISVSLYLYTAFHAISKGFKTMEGSISSVNLNSLNMFLFLGARLNDVYDIYILENKK
jgi:ribosomal protein S18 acetylase RimI-like enzyme